MAKHAKGRTRIREEVRPVLEIRPNIHQLGRTLNPLSSPWPFAQWGLDIVGPFPKAAGNKRYMVVSTNYFTKWVEVEPQANFKDADVKRFVWKISSLGSRSLIPSFWTMASNSIAKPSRCTVASWGLRIDILPQPTPRGMDKLKLSTRSV